MNVVCRLAASVPSIINVGGSVLWRICIVFALRWGSDDLLTSLTGCSVDWSLPVDVVSVKACCCASLPRSNWFSLGCLFSKIPRSFGVRLLRLLHGKGSLPDARLGFSGLSRS